MKVPTTTRTSLTHENQTYRKGTTMSQTSKRPTPEAFVTAWMMAFKEDRPMQDLAGELGLNMRQVRERKRHYKRRGVNLPELRNDNARNTLDIDGLNELMKGLL